MIFAQGLKIIEVAFLNIHPPTPLEKVLLSTFGVVKGVVKK
jgi:hypothetical protein